MRKYYGGWFDLYEFSKRGKSEYIPLVVLATSERNDWLFSYRTLKQLRQDGFI